MGFIYLFVGLVAATELAAAQKAPVVKYKCPRDSSKEELHLRDTYWLLSFVVFRHGDRTPDQSELDLYPEANTHSKNILFPYGEKASLTNKGKQRGRLVGDYLRRRYDGFLSPLYLPYEISVRTTDYARTQMTALTAMSGLYPPPLAQRWNPALDWQPVPYNTLPRDQDDLLYYINCPRYLTVRDQVYKIPEVKVHIVKYQKLFKYLSEKTNINVTTTENVLYLDNLLQDLSNVGYKTPAWAKSVMPQIKEVTKLEYAIQFYNRDLVRMASGVLMTQILDATAAAIKGNLDQPKVRVYSGHDINVAALMAAVGVFEPHQPNYGATFALELRKQRATGKFGIAAVYATNAGGPAQVLPVAGCGGLALCPYGRFVTLTRDLNTSYEDYVKECFMRMVRNPFKKRNDSDKI